MKATYCGRLKAGAKALSSEGLGGGGFGSGDPSGGFGEIVFQSAVGKVLLEDYMRKLERTGAEDSLRAFVASRARNSSIGGGKGIRARTSRICWISASIRWRRTGAGDAEAESAWNPELILYAVRKGVIS